MGRARGIVLFALAVIIVISPVVVSLVAAPALAGAATGPPETTTTPDDGPDGHADDPFPRLLPVAFAGVLVVGIAAVGGGLWVVYARFRRFLGR